MGGVMKELGEDLDGNYGCLEVEQRFRCVIGVFMYVAQSKVDNW